MTTVVESNVLPTEDVEHAQLVDNLASLTRACGQLRFQIAQLREDAGRAVAEAKRDHGWCDVAESAVDEAGCIWVDLEPVPQTYTIKLRVDVEITASTTCTDEAEDTAWIEQSIRLNEDQIAAAISMDDDWGDDAVTVTNHEVVDVE